MSSDDQHLIVACVKHEVATSNDHVAHLSGVGKMSSRFHEATTPLVEKVAFDLMPSKQHDRN